tara:strand:+ start:134 stop:1888 length:1755 start_codon:yes stop_codon:yes gene_type:complete
MTTLVFDIETNGLKPSKIWCMAVVNADTEELKSFGPDKLDEAVEYLKSADKLVGHNIIGYDIPVIKKLMNTDLKEHAKVIDTLVLSRLFNPTREGGHSLESWGYRVGLNKIEFDEYDTYSQEMLSYCETDTVLNNKIFTTLKTEASNFSSSSIRLEHQAAEIMHEQREHGFLLDVPKATLLIAELSDKIYEVETKVHETFRPKKIKTVLKATFTKSGALSKMANIEGSIKKSRLSPEEYEEIAIKRTLTRINEEPFNLGSRKQIGEYLIDFGWEPKKFTPTGQPIVDEGTLSKIKDIPEAKLIAEYLLLQKRIAQLNSWVKEAHEDDRVRGFVNPNGTITGRMTHNSPNMAQCPSVRSPYGKECRECWTVPEGYKLVGIDASGLELRMLAHYMNDEAYTNEILHGDIHTANQKLAGLESRDQSKTFIYALIYGAGNAKLGSVVGGNKTDGERLRKRFLDNLPSFKALRDRVSRASTKGYVKGLDGRKLFIRSEHSALNTLLQGAGAIVMKEAMRLLHDRIKWQGLDAHFVCNVHDEWQLEVREDNADIVGTAGIESIEDAGKVLNLRCPLTGEYNVGTNWAETH